MLEEDVLPKPALCFGLLCSKRQVQLLVLGRLSHRQAHRLWRGRGSTALAVPAAVMLGPSIWHGLAMHESGNSECISIASYTLLL